MNENAFRHTNGWAIDFESMKGFHEVTGLRMHFAANKDGSWDGFPINEMSELPPELRSSAPALARLMREAGDAFAQGLEERKRP